MQEGGPGRHGLRWLPEVQLRLMHELFRQVGRSVLSCVAFCSWHVRVHVQKKTCTCVSTKNAYPGVFHLTLCKSFASLLKFCRPERKKYASPPPYLTPSLNGPLGRVQQACRHGFHDQPGPTPPPSVWKPSLNAPLGVQKVPTMII